MQQKIRVITDCTDIKQEAIRGVFAATFHSLQCIVVAKHELPTPLSFDGFCKTIKRRMELLMQSSDASGDSFYCATVQRGYIFDGSLWHLFAAVSIGSSRTHTAQCFASSVVLSNALSIQKNRDRQKSFKEILPTEFPNWNGSSSVYELLTGEKERDWLQQPLRFCLRQILKEQKTPA